jgi:hypothetical protein
MENKLICENTRHRYELRRKRETNTKTKIQTEKFIEDKENQLNITMTRKSNHDSLNDLNNFNDENDSPILERKAFLKKKNKLVEKLSKLIRSNIRSKITKENIKRYSDSYFINLLKQRLSITMPKSENKIQKEMSLIFEKKIIEEKKICSICIDETDYESRHYLKCGHFFHHDCLYRWLDQNTQCPVCRLVLHKDYKKINLSESSESISDSSDDSNFSLSLEDLHTFDYSDDFFNNVVFVIVIYILAWSMIKTIGFINYIPLNI